MGGQCDDLSKGIRWEDRRTRGSASGSWYRGGEPGDMAGEGEAGGLRGNHQVYRLARQGGEAGEAAAGRL